MLLCVLGVTSAILFWTVRQPKIYEATCSIIIEPNAPKILKGVQDVVELGANSYWANKEFYATQEKVIQSKDVAEQLVHRLGLAGDPTYPVPGLKERPSAEALNAAVRRQTSVTMLKDSRIAQIAVRDRDPKRAARIANGLADSYMDLNVDLKLDGSKLALTWLGDQVVDLKAKLQTSEMALYTFRNQRQLLDVNLGDRQSMTAQNLQIYNQKLAEVRSKRMEVESQRKVIGNARGKPNEEESLPAIRENTVIQQLRIRYLELTKSRAEAEAQYLEKHPKFVVLGDQIRQLLKEYNSEIDKVLLSVDKQYEMLLDYEKSLVSQMEQEKKRAIELAKLEVEYKPLEREAENDTKLYQMVLERQKETGISGLIRSNNVRILDRAEAPKVPVKPRPVLNIIVAMVLGLSLGIGTALGIEALDNTVKGPEQIEGLLTVPVLGTVPIIGDRGRRKKLSPEELQQRDLYVLRDPKSTAAEACRSVRTNLLFLSPDKPLRSLVLTSPGPQEGKTTTAINLAIAMATAGARVLLVDTDMRRPRIHKSFSLSNDIGVSTVVVGETPIDQAIVKTEVENLDLLRAGPCPVNPAELLHTEKFRQMAAECIARYDRVIFDSPPTSAVTDPAILANLTDGAIVVLRSGSTTKQAAKFACRQLLDAKANILGVIINHLDLSSYGAGYKYYSYYRQYGPYGYSEDSAKA